jgi:hypothetical protein
LGIADYPQLIDSVIERLNLNCSQKFDLVIDSLLRKPGALLHYTWQQDLLPNDNYRQLWQKLLAQKDLRKILGISISAIKCIL